MRLSLRHAFAVFAALALVMAATRAHHFGPMPDASWAVFFAAGFYLKGHMRWVFPALMALAVLVDYVVITASGLSFWQHYCVSPGYWFLLPAHASLWLAGTWASAQGRAPSVALLGRAVLALALGAATCHLFAQGGFYWFSSSVAEPTVAGWAKNYSDWLLPYTRVLFLYAALAAVVHVLVAQLRGLSACDQARAD